MGSICGLAGLTSAFCDSGGEPVVTRAGIRASGVLAETSELRLAIGAATDELSRREASGCRISGAPLAEGLLRRGVMTVVRGPVVPPVGAGGGELLLPCGVMTALSRLMLTEALFRGAISTWRCTGGENVRTLVDGGDAGCTGLLRPADVVPAICAGGVARDRSGLGADTRGAGAADRGDTLGAGGGADVLGGAAGLGVGAGLLATGGDDVLGAGVGARLGAAEGGGAEGLDAAAGALDAGRSLEPAGAPERPF
jgi:hypothetical protein